jgi:hypothetical protein
LEFRGDLAGLARSQQQFGWRGIMPNGSVIETRSAHPGVHAQTPEHHLRWTSNGECMGAYLIERPSMAVGSAS